MVQMKGYLSLLAVLVVPPALACGGGGGDDLSKAFASVSPDDIGSMVLEQDKLGGEFAYLEMDPDSGPSDNEDAAATTIDPDDTADDLSRLGRVGGYSLTYVDPGLAAPDVGERVISISMELDLFLDSAGAARFLAKQRGDFQRFVGSTLENGVALQETETFSVDSVGDEATGLRIRAGYEGTQFYQTVVAFRLDRLVAAAVLFRADRNDAASQVQRIASALAARIEEVSLGSALVREQGEPTGDQINPEGSGGTVDGSLAGEWRVYSETLFYDAGGSGGSDSAASTTRMLVLKDDGTWEFGSSAGSWYVTSIDPSDWDRWGSTPYGPERKIVLDGWNGGVADGPVEELAGAVDFVWVIYRVDAPDPGTVQMKFGHA